MRGDMLLDFNLTKERPVEHVKTEGSLGFCNNKQVEFMSREKKVKNRITSSLDFRRAHFGLYRNCLVRVHWNMALEKRGV